MLLPGCGFEEKNLVFGLFLSMMMIPTELVVITNFVTITNMDLRNSFLGLILPSITSVFYIYLLKENFEQVPEELYKAAKVDGTSDLKYLWKVMIPICRPTLVTITILKLIECWNSYVWPRLITDDPAYYLVSNGIQEIRENGFGRGKYPRHDGRGSGHFRSSDSAVFGIPQKDYGGRIQRRDQGMKRLFCLALALLLCLSLFGCHGQREQAAFTVPSAEGSLEESYEITLLGQKRHQHAPKPTFTAGPLRSFRTCIPTSLSP